MPILTFVGGTDDNRWIDLSNVSTTKFLCRFVQEHGKSIHRLSAFCRTAPLKTPVLAEKRGLMFYARLLSDSCRTTYLPSIFQKSSFNLYYLSLNMKVLVFTHNDTTLSFFAKTFLRKSIEFDKVTIYK
jgi:hypothetical protein